MGFTTAIPWCHHTFNLWWGCVEVSPACDDWYHAPFTITTSPARQGVAPVRRTR